MTENWDAVTREVRRRMAELTLSQRELIERSHVSKAIVSEIQNNTVTRRRGTRTLEALSRALGLHPGHLAAVLHGRTPPEIGEPEPVADNDVPTRLDGVEYRLRRLSEQIDSRMDSLDDRLDEIAASVRGRQGT